MEKNLYEQICQHSNKRYDNKEVVRLLVMITKGVDKTDLTKNKLKLFIGLSKIIMKAVNNFFSICKKHDVKPEKLILTEEDITNECYLVLENSVKNLKPKYIKIFYFYFNSGLNRAMYRLYRKYYERQLPTIVNTDQNEEVIFNNLKSKEHFDTLQIDFCNFTEIEIAIIKFKMRKGKLKDFLKKQNLPSNQYYLIWDALQKKIFDLYKDEETGKLNY